MCIAVHYLPPTPQSPAYKCHESRGFTDFIYLWYLEQYLAHSKCSINVTEQLFSGPQQGKEFAGRSQSNTPYWPKLVFRIATCLASQPAVSKVHKRNLVLSSWPPRTAPRTHRN